MSHSTIKVLRPLLPDAGKILPYIECIDANRTYSNYGPLNSEFARRLADLVGGAHATTTSNGTTAIEVALRLRTTKRGGLCLMPAFTFIASAHAVCNAGLVPHLLDIDAESLMLTPEIAAEAMMSLAGKVAAVLVVSAYGAPLDLDGWSAFEDRFGVPVVFDAAAALTSIGRVGSQPVCVSLHATKTLGIGEGGAILTSDGEFAERAKAMTGFGFAGADRLASFRSGNYRISEYAAAVGLAALDGLPAKLEQMRDLTLAYAERIRGKAVSLQAGVGSEWVSMTFNVLADPAEVDATTRRFDEANVEWRRWWGLGCHRHPAFSDVPRSQLDVTDRTAPRVLGLPFHTDLSTSDLDRVVACLA
ncbi:MAG: DegT/DnrJ/EryC1/StrS family aminotransferase [Polaromonas sp.]|nr:DegT/DnrJ/EryC1/StrS family aminotransferase [Polaromonas sp.]